MNNYSISFNIISIILFYFILLQSFKDVYSYSSTKELESTRGNIKNRLKLGILEDSSFNIPNKTFFTNNLINLNEFFGKLSNENENIENLTSKAILLLGGFGNRFNYDFSKYPDGTYYIPEGVPKVKQFIHIFNIPLFVYSFTELLNNPYINEIILVSKPKWYNHIVEMILRSRDFISNYNNNIDPPGYSMDLIDNYSFGKVNKFVYDQQKKDFILDLKDLDLNDFDKRYKFIKFSESGSERCYSTYKGLKTLESFTDNEDIVLIHDGARPLIRYIDIENLIKSAKKYGGAIPGYRSQDTVKLINDGKVTKTLDRSKTFIIQTPQAFKFGLLIQAYKNVLESDTFNYDPKLFNYFTDDSSFLESQFKNHIVIIDGHKFNLKLSYNNDLDLCRFLIKQTLFPDSSI